ncbi:MAG: hypothetical protein SNI45_02925 [Rikenellaceae bacterium]
MVAKQSLTSPLLDQNLISGAKNILVNFVTAEANGLTVSELDTVLTYIQSHATIQEVNGKRHTANIIWGTSTKPNLGKKLELVVVATGFNDNQLEIEPLDFEPTTFAQEDKAATAPQSEADRIEPAVVEEPTPAPVAEPTPAPTAQPKQVVLGSRKSRYANIDQIANQPAYKTRKVELIVTPNSKKEVLKESTSEQRANDDSLLFK